MSTQDYDVIVIGTGTAGGTAAYQLSEAGKRVAIIDAVPFGGTCALRGCQPKKYLVVNTHLAAHTQTLVGKGYRAAATTDWAQLQAFKREFTDPIPESSVRSYREQGIDPYFGSARFVDRSTVVLEPGGERLSADTVLIATGARSRELDIPGAEHTSTSDDFLELDSLPESMVCIGGGYISLEFAFIAGLAGVKVTVLQRGDRALPQFPASLVDRVVAAGREHNVRVVTGVDVERVEKTNGELSVVTRDHGSFTGGFVMAAVGRVPNTDGLGLESIGVTLDRGAIVVDEYMQTSVDGVYAIGDCVATKQLAPISDMEAKAAAANIVSPRSVKVRYDSIPSVVFTHPQMAGVGLSAGEADPDTMKVKSGSGAGWPNNRRLHADPVYYETVTDAQSGLILGAHLVGPYAGEQINIFALALASGTTADQLRALPWAYPTHASDVKYMV
ncbi:MAG: NAD(P)/FAD-dependent oxidoreductase [Spirochaetaceae bacterium]|nr:MAG: NAD(P)/FAD-dependent oxidoreductase [Spirochaetaceae bacterium]